MIDTIKRLYELQSKHPYDWIIHFVGYFLAVIFGTPWWIATIFGLIVEKIQKKQIWYNDLSWWEYIKKHAAGDIVANSLGILIAWILKYGWCHV